MIARRYVVLALAAAVALNWTGMTAAQAQRPATASFRFGIAGGNIVPFVATISRTGAVTFTRGGQRSKRTPLTVAAVNRLFALAKAQQFYALPASISCTGALPDMGTEFITIRTARKSKTVREHGACNRRFEKLYARLSAVVAPR